MSWHCTRSLVCILCLLNLFVEGCNSKPSNVPSNLTPSFEAAEYRKFPISKADIQHGKEQFAQLKKDRPEMAGYVEAGDGAYNSLVRQFAGEGVGYRIFWKNESPQNGADGENHYDEHPPRGLVRVKRQNKDAYDKAEAQWSTLVYEVINIRTTPSFQKAWTDALAKRINKEEWMRICCSLEFRTMKRAKSFYREVWVPRKNFRRSHFQERLWNGDIGESFENWFASAESKPYIEFWSAHSPP